MGNNGKGVNLTWKTYGRTGDRNRVDNLQRGVDRETIVLERKVNLTPQERAMREIMNTPRISYGRLVDREEKLRGNRQYRNVEEMYRDLANGD